MNKFVSTALAGALTLSAVGVSASGASADQWKHHHQPQQQHYYQPRPSYDPGAAIIAGTVFGLALGGALASEPAYGYGYYPPAPPPGPPPPYYPGYYAGDPHFDWCSATYESYNGETDTWTDYRGIVHRCVGPY